MSYEKKLIYADDLMNAIRDDHNINGAHFARLRRHIDAAPDVEAVPVVHGEWKVIEDCYLLDTIYQCSACKEEFVTIDGTPAENLWKYCPYCGAIMDEDAE